MLPLTAFSIVSTVLAGGGLRHAVRPLVAFGASPARVTLTTVTAAVLVTALVTGALAGAVAAVAGSAQPGADLVTSTWVGALAGGAYAAWFCAGSSFGARGGGRAAALIFDYLLGAGTSAAALLSPRGHLRSLLG